MRNRRHVIRKGPLVVYQKDEGIQKAFRNLPGVEVQSVDRLNLLQLAPGGHLGRFIVWTRGAFNELNNIYGSTKRESTSKKGFHLPFPTMTNSDISRIINSDEVQSVVRSAKKSIKRKHIKKNPLKNLGAKIKLNPYALTLRRSELLAQERRATRKAAIEAARKGTPVERTRAEAVATQNRQRHKAQQTVNYDMLTNDDFKKPEKRVAVGKAKLKMQVGKK